MLLHVVVEGAPLARLVHAHRATCLLQQQVERWVAVGLLVQAPGGARLLLLPHGIIPCVILPVIIVVNVCMCWRRHALAACMRCTSEATVHQAMEVCASICSCGCHLLLQVPLQPQAGQGAVAQLLPKCCGVASCCCHQLRHVLPCFLYYCCCYCCLLGKQVFLQVCIVCFSICCLGTCSWLLCHVLVIIFWVARQWSS
jgi:hypothetical protein